VESKLLRRYLAAQALAIATFAFVPLVGCLHLVWQVAVGWASAFFVLVGIRRARPAPPLAWYALGAGVFLNATGLLVEWIGERYFQAVESPTLADAFFLAIFPGFILGLGSLVWRRSASESSLSLIVNTLVCALLAAGLSIVAWEFIVWQAQTDPSLSLSKRLIVTAYPLGDLLVLVLMVRLFAGGARNATFVLVVVAMVFFLGADIGWAAILRQGLRPGPDSRRLLEMASMLAFTLVGAAALHPATHAVAESDEEHQPARASLRWAALVVCIATAPIVLLTQALLDRWYSLRSL
jgi:hypothetical protein